MKNILWNILSIFLVVGIIVMAAVIYLLFRNPDLPFNPFAPRDAVPTLSIPTDTASPMELPPTWTPTSKPPTIAGATLRPSSTPLPTNTPFFLPTMTPLSKLTMPTNDRLPLVGKCKVVNQTPKDGSLFKAKEAFTTTWTLENTGVDDWTADGIDIKFWAGEAMHTGRDLLDFGRNVKAGTTTDVSIPMAAPEKKGYHITYWALVAGDKTRCSFYVEIFTDD